MFQGSNLSRCSVGRGCVKTAQHIIGEQLPGASSDRRLSRIALDFAPLPQVVRFLAQRRESSERDSCALGEGTHGGSDRTVRKAVPRPSLSIAVEWGPCNPSTHTAARNLGSARYSTCRGAALPFDSRNIPRRNCSYDLEDDQSMERSCLQSPRESSTPRPQIGSVQLCPVRE
jgi:hypothetical protein